MATEAASEPGASTLKRMDCPVIFGWHWIGPAVFVALVWNTNWSQVWEAWRQGRAELLLAAAGCNGIIMLLKAWRWRYLMRLQDIQYRLAPAVRYYVIGSALGAWTPGRVGDFSKALVVHRDRKVGLGRAASSVIADRVLDVMALAGVAAVGAALLPGSHRPLWLAAAGIGASAVTAWFLIRTTPNGMVRRYAERIVGKLRRLGAAGEEVGAALGGLVDLARPALVVPMGLTAIATTATFVQGYLLALSLGIDVGFWTLSVALAATSIASILPVTVAGFGTREATLLLLLGAAGIRWDQIIAFSLAYVVAISGSLALMGAAAWVMAFRALSSSSTAEYPGDRHSVNNATGLPADAP
jgi:glycosyltransferase 2 family protein